MTEPTTDSEIDPYLAEQYDNSSRVANAAALIDAFTADAATFRDRDGLTADYAMRYGNAERNLLDIFWPDEVRDAPLTMFIHGGYWQRLDRSDFSHMAAGLLEHGIGVAIPSYTLCPDTTVAGIVTEMRRACLLLHQTYKRPLTVFGHSAGGHLAACVFATDWPSLHPELPEDLVQSGLGLSGLYDLHPLVRTHVNDALALDEQTAEASSPLGWLPQPLHRFDTWVGSAESDEYHRQSRQLSSRWSLLGTPSLNVEVDGANHFTIVDGLTDAESAVVRRLATLVGEPSDACDIPDPDEDAVLAAMQTFSSDAGENTDGENEDEQKATAAPEEA